MSWTPRNTHVLLPHHGKTNLFSATRKTKFTFAPSTTRRYISPNASPKISPGRKKAPPAAALKSLTPVSELEAQANEFLAEAASYERSAVSNSAIPPLSIQLGLLVICKEDFIKRCLTQWDAKGRKEFAKTEFRLNLRKAGLDPAAFDADALFDKWDADGGGTLDLAELKEALTKVGTQARTWRFSIDPAATQAVTLRTRAKYLHEAAEATTLTEQLESEFEALRESQAASAEIRLGELLAKRCIKPGTVVTKWSTSRGEHAGELSKTEFREAVKKLGLANSGVSEADIDNVFDKFDEDHGGYLDAQEASAMVKELQATAGLAQKERWRKENLVAAKRARAIQMEALALETATESGAKQETNKDAAKSSRPIDWTAWLKPERQNSLVAEGILERKQREKRDKKQKERDADKTERSGTATALTTKKLSAQTALDVKGLVTGSQTSAPSAAATLASAPVEAIDATARLMEAAMRAVTTTLSRGGGAKSERALRKTATTVASRLQNIELAFCWNTWTDYVFHTRQIRACLDRSIAVLRAPIQIRSFNKWHEYMEERRHATTLLSTAMARLRYGAGVGALARWREFTALQRKRDLAASSTTRGGPCEALALAFKCLQ